MLLLFMRWIPRGPNFAKIHARGARGLQRIAPRDLIPPPGAQTFAEQSGKVYRGAGRVEGRVGSLRRGRLAWRRCGTPRGGRREAWRAGLPREGGKWRSPGGGRGRWGRSGATWRQCRGFRSSRGDGPGGQPGATWGQIWAAAGPPRRFQTFRGRFAGKNAGKTGVEGRKRGPRGTGGAFFRRGRGAASGGLAKTL